MSATLRISDRLEIITASRPAHAATFAEDVRNGLRAKPKKLPPKYFYDELGSALFEAITRLPEYYLTNAETEILREYGWEIVRLIRSPIEIMELGSGSANKTRLLIEETLRVQNALRYCPIDISPDALRASASALVDSYPRLSVRAYAGDYFTILGSRELELRHPVLALLLGSNIGNYEPPMMQRLLDAVGASLKPGDGLLVGADLRKDSATLELAYNDPTGVTAAFNKNLLGRLNRELGANFDLRAFEHVSNYDQRRGVVDSSLLSHKKQQIQIEQLGLDVDFEAGEALHTESSYKFTIEQLTASAKQAGFSLARSWFDHKRYFSVSLFLRT
ncbi:MAG: L-histidine N(alpha)-methyltransferase [Candidatus Eremiobacteraeota bacterium]|nr:L-histidine N(alpha)-methyltransferase [Candidatus Eremiobacteraeota bacterium]